MFVRTDQPPEVGALLKIECDLPNDSPSPFAAVARVAWVRLEESPPWGGPGMGLKFVRLEPGSEAQLEQFLADLAPTLDETGRALRCSEPPTVSRAPAPRPSTGPVGTLTGGSRAPVAPPTHTATARSVTPGVTGRPGPALAQAVSTASQLAEPIHETGLHSDAHLGSTAPSMVPSPTAEPDGMPGDGAKNADADTELDADARFELDEIAHHGQPTASVQPGEPALADLSPASEDNGFYSQAPEIPATQGAIQDATGTNSSYPAPAQDDPAAAVVLPFSDENGLSAEAIMDFHEGSSDGPSGVHEDSPADYAGQMEDAEAPATDSEQALPLGAVPAGLRLLPADTESASGDGSTSSRDSSAVVDAILDAEAEDASSEAGFDGAKTSTSSNPRPGPRDPAVPQRPLRHRVSAPKKRFGRILWAGLVPLLLLAAAFFLWRDRGSVPSRDDDSAADTQTQAGTRQADDSQAAGPAKSSQTLSAQAVEGARNPAQPSQQAPSSHYVVEVITKPRGAQVLIGEQRLTAPTEVQFRALPANPLRVQAELPGYRSASTVVQAGMFEKRENDLHIRVELELDPIKLQTKP